MSHDWAVEIDFEKAAEDATRHLPEKEARAMTDRCLPGLLGHVRETVGFMGGIEFSGFDVVRCDGDKQLIISNDPETPFSEYISKEI